METKLQLIKSDKFGEIQCDFYEKGNEFYMTREQIGAALEYGDPIRAISKLHDRHADRLAKYSAVVKLTTTDGKAYDTTVYNRKAVMEICRHSDQPKADAFMDWAWGILDDLMAGKTKIVLRDSYTIEDPIERAQIWIQEKKRLMLAEADVKEFAPKAAYYDMIMKNPGLVTITSISKDYGMSGFAMNKLLHEYGIQYKQGDQWLLYAKYQDCGYVGSQNVDIVRSDGRSDINPETKWTQKGRKFLYDFLKDGIFNGILPVIEQEPFIQPDKKKAIKNGAEQSEGAA